jgi:hypothetical protein
MGVCILNSSLSLLFFSSVSFRFVIFCSVFFSFLLQTESQTKQNYKNQTKLQRPNINCRYRQRERPKTTGKEKDEEQDKWQRRKRQD